MTARTVNSPDYWTGEPIYIPPTPARFYPATRHVPESLYVRPDPPPSKPIVWGSRIGAAPPNLAPEIALAWGAALFDAAYQRTALGEGYGFKPRKPPRLPAGAYMRAMAVLRDAL